MNKNYNQTYLNYHKKEILMKTISNKDIQDYSNSEDFEYVDTIGGTLPKGFVRLDNKYLKNQMNIMKY